MRLIAFLAVNAQNASKTTQIGSTEIGPEVVVETVQRQIHFFLTLLPNFVLCGVFLVFVWLVAFGIRRFILSAGRHLNPPLVRALARLGSITVWILGMFTAATIVIPSFNPGNVIAGLGISSIAIGFAFKDIFQNFLAGLLLLWNQPFHVGDQIKSGDFEGQVEDIDIRATLIRTYAGERAIVPNSSVYTNPIIVKTAFRARRAKIDITVEDQRPAAEVRGAVEKVVQQTPGVLANPAPEVVMIGIKGNSTHFIVYLWSEQCQAAQEAALTALRNAFDPAKTEITSG